jgi:hypothetical protein
MCVIYDGYDPANRPAFHIPGQKYGYITVLVKGMLLPVEKLLLEILHRRYPIGIVTVQSERKIYEFTKRPPAAYLFD